MSTPDRVEHPRNGAIPATGDQADGGPDAFSVSIPAFDCPIEVVPNGPEHILWIAVLAYLVHLWSQVDAMMLVWGMIKR